MKHRVDWEQLEVKMKSLPDLFVTSGEPLYKHTSLRLGGETDLWVEPATPEAAAIATEMLNIAGVHWIVLGGGTNVLFSDCGFRGVVFSTARLRGMMISGESVSAKAGSNLSSVICATLEAGLGGMEELLGIPGTVGGAVAGNAGAGNQEIFDCIKRIRLTNSSGQIAWMDRDEFSYAYRRVGLPENSVVLEVEWALSSADSTLLKEKAQEMKKRRLATQPIGLPTAGCMFKNPPGESAGRLIDKAGLKGAGVGSALVSTKHANFIVIDGLGSADDVRELIRIVKEKVVKDFGILLRTELVIVEEGQL